MKWITEHYHFKLLNVQFRSSTLISSCTVSPNITRNINTTVPASRNDDQNVITDLTTSKLIYLNIAEQIRFILIKIVTKKENFQEKIRKQPMENNRSMTAHHKE